jgi:hypothetical protein
MQRTILTAISFVGIVTTANAQTTPNTGTDRLGVPTSTLSSTSTFPTGTSLPTTSGSVTTSGPGVAGGSGISASVPRSAQAPLQIPGEGLGTSTQSASTTATAPGAPSTICPPPIPTTDGGSANITAIDGFSPRGC